VSFFRRNRFSLTIIVLVLSALAFFSYNAGRPGASPGVGRYLVEIIAPAQKVVTAVGDFIENIWRRYFALVQAAKENEKLSSLVDQMRQEVATMEEMRLENKRLRGLLGLEERAPEAMAAAQVVGGDPSGYFRTVLIDRGDKGGVAATMPVLNAAGVVGRVVWTSPNFAKVLLLTDHNSGVDVLVQRTRARGVVQGAGRDLLKLKYLLHSEEVRPGDKLITSGVEGVFPKGLLVGYVLSAKATDKGVFLDVEARPAVDFNRLEDVVVILAGRKLPE